MNELKGIKKEKLWPKKKKKESLYILFLLNSDCSFSVFSESYMSPTLI